MDFTGCESIASDDRVVHEHHLHAETVFLGEHAVRVRLCAMICRDNREPSGPDVVRKPEDLLIRIPLVLTDSFDWRKPVAGNVFVFADCGDALRIRRFRLRPFSNWPRRGSAPNSSSAHHVDAGADQTGDKKDGNQLAGPCETCLCLCHFDLPFELDSRGRSLPLA